MQMLLAFILVAIALMSLSFFMANMDFFYARRGAVFIFTLGDTNVRLKIPCLILMLLRILVVPWYRRNPQVFGTITGLIFIALMLLALAYYCYNTDVNVNRPLPYHNQSPLPCHLQRNNDASFNGVRLSPGVHMASNSERQKSCRQVRHQSITTLGAISKQSIERLKKARAMRKESIKPLSFVSTHV